MKANKEMKTSSRQIVKTNILQFSKKRNEMLVYDMIQFRKVMFSVFTYSLGFDISNSKQKTRQKVNDIIHIHKNDRQLLKIRGKWLIEVLSLLKKVINRSMLVDTEKYLNSVLPTFLKKYFVGEKLGLENYPKYGLEKAVQKFEVRINISGN